MQRLQAWGFDMRKLLAVLFLVLSSRCCAGQLDGICAIVTGGSRGIGEACVLALAREGANVAIVVNQSVEEAEGVAKKAKGLGIDSCVIPCDVANPEAVKAMAEEVVRRWGKIDVLVNNAGMTHGSAAEDLSIEAWQRMIDVNLTGVFLCAQAVGKKMIEQGTGGSIINISSICGHIVVIPQKQCHYNASKGGVGMLTKSLAVEWAEHGIRVNAISPGYVKTRILDFAKELHPIWIEKTPMKTMGEAEDIAEAVVYLAGPRAKYVTGSDWIIDGGYTAP
jgi:NAD(P)-dependent dehydrogenase (short-subunit alcohol dehydrogenase family)